MQTNREASDMRGNKQNAGAILRIDLDAVRANYRFLRRQAGTATCAAAVKADAYGLGAARIAPALVAEGCRHFFVAHLDEGIALRSQVPDAMEIFVLHGPPPDTEPEFLHHRLIPVLNSPEQIAGWRRTAQLSDRRLPAIVQVDSGMSRMGLAPAEVDDWLNDPDFLSGIEPRFLMSHLACAESQDHPMNASQLRAFNAVRARLPGCPASLANSSGIFLGPEFHFDLVRPGAALYGVAPVAKAANPMRPVVRLQTKIIQTRTIASGEAVGYGVSYRASSTRRIATIAVGYADGWLRSLSNRGLALIGGTQVPIVGKVSMDTCSIDVSDINPDLLYPGACVDLISPEQTVDDVAALANTIGYEILTSLGGRYHRDYVGGEQSNN
jgi:alanine racemase